MHENREIFTIFPDFFFFKNPTETSVFFMNTKVFDLLPLELDELMTFYLTPSDKTMKHFRNNEQPLFESNVLLQFDHLFKLLASFGSFGNKQMFFPRKLFFVEIGTWRKSKFIGCIGGGVSMSSYRVCRPFSIISDFKRFFNFALESSIRWKFLLRVKRTFSRSMDKIFAYSTVRSS